MRRQTSTGIRAFLHTTLLLLILLTPFDPLPVFHRLSMIKTAHLLDLDIVRHVARVTNPALEIPERSETCLGSVHCQIAPDQYEQNVPMLILTMRCQLSLDT